MLDERVLTYCQPVFNLKTGKYDTAEALMRLNLPKMGLVFPDRFISLAEENGYIHALRRSFFTKPVRRSKAFWRKDMSFIAFPSMSPFRKCERKDLSAT